MRIYLADLFHLHAYDAANTLPKTVPLGIGFVAAAVKRQAPGADVRLFRDPDRLFAAARAEPPHILGLCFTSWTLDISNRAAQRIKHWSPSTIVVGGGPCVDDQGEQLLAFFAKYPDIDYLIPDEGENGFVALVTHLESGAGNEGVIPGVAHLDPAGRLVHGAYRMPSLTPLATQEEVPSPYLDGTLDPFLSEGLVPIVQTMRGCPYRCEFCVSGTTLWNKPRAFPLERVESEIDYALSKGGSKSLILTDENWGILGTRDVELAQYIMNRHKALGSPARVYYYTAKEVNDASRAIVELVSPIAWIGEFNMAFQSLNPQTRKAIKRTNISLEKLTANVRWADERGIQTSSEMIFGFPYQTVDSFIEGIETLFDMGIPEIFVFPLQLFPGMELASDTTRRECGSRTRFRLADCGHGVYLNGELVSAESEEIVVGTKWFGWDGYVQIRRYGFFHMLLRGRGYFDEFFELCREAGIPTARLTRFITMSDLAAHPSLEAIMDDHERDTRDELELTHEDVVKSVAERLHKGQKIGGVKLNLVYMGQILSNRSAVGELVNLIDLYVRDVGGENPAVDVVRAYLRQVLPSLIVVFEPFATECVSFDTHFDYAGWQAGTYRSVTELLRPVSVRLDAVTPEAVRLNLRDFDGTTDQAALQAVFDRAYGKKLLRTVLLTSPVPMP